MPAWALSDVWHLPSGIGNLLKEEDRPAEGAAEGEAEARGERDDPVRVPVGAAVGTDFTCEWWPPD